MADGFAISELPAATSVDRNDLVAIVQDGDTKKAITAMLDFPIDSFPAAGPVDGSELVKVEQSGSAVQTTIAAIAGLHRVRQRLTGDATYYVDPAGSNSNDGSAGHPWRTIQHAIDVVTFDLDLAGYLVTIQLADGTYSEDLEIEAPLVGGGAAAGVSIVGNTDTPGAVTISSTFHCIHVVASVGWNFTGMDLDGGGTGACVVAEGQARIILDTVRFGNASAHLSASSGAQIFTQGANAILGDAIFHAAAQIGCIVTLAGTFEIPSALVFSIFALCRHGHINAGSAGYTGSGVAGTTGQRYDVAQNGVITVIGGSGTFFPGNVAGIFGSGGQYV